MRTLAAASIALGCVAHGAMASAQQTVRRFDVRASFGVGFHAGGGLSNVAAGPVLAPALQFDWRPVPLVSLELELAAGYVPVSVPDGGNLPGYVFDAAVNAGVGLHAPFGLYLSARGGAHDLYQELRAGMLAEAGWDIRITPGFSVGPFVRATYVFGASDRDALGLFVGGVTFALGPATPVSPPPSREEPPQETPRETVTTTNTTTPVATPVHAMEDGDRDGIDDAVDRCPSSDPDATVDATGCAPAVHPAAAHPHAPHGRRRHAH